MKPNLESYQLLEHSVFFYRCEPLGDCVQNFEVALDSLQAVGNKGLDMFW